MNATNRFITDTNQVEVWVQRNQKGSAFRGLDEDLVFK